MTQKQEFQFEASAYLQTLLGRELIRNEDLALIELIKNSYDSGARSLTITITSPSIKHPGEISLLDDGRGMDPSQFEQSFMFAGFSTKNSQKQAGRVQTGEKGIGRFAADRLGTRLSVTTKTVKRDSALHVEIDWKDFDDRRKKFSDVKVPYRDVDPPARIGKHGTLLVISNLREIWERNSVERLKNALGELLDPYAMPDDFRIELQAINAPSLSGEITTTKPHDVDIEVVFHVDENGKIVRKRRGVLYEGAIKNERYTPSYDTSKLKGLSGRYLYFLEKPKKSAVNGITSGVRLYRDGFRVEPLGSGKADWLGIAEKRAKRAGHAHVVPSRLFGFVSVSRVKNSQLKDTTSREALIDSPEVEALISALKDQVSFLEESIRVDVAEQRWLESKTKQAVALQQARLQSLSILSTGLGHELRQPLQGIRMDADNIRIRLTQLNITDTLISEAQRNIDESIDRIDKNINMIANIATGDVDKSERVSAAQIVISQLAVLEPRCAAQGVQLRIDIPNDFIVMSNETMIGTVLLNLIQNSLDSFKNVVDRRKKMLTVSMHTAPPAMVAVSVADNAGGIPEATRTKIFKHFATQKTGGWGIGLYNCKLFLESHGGGITFESAEGKGATFTFTLPQAV